MTTTPTRPPLRLSSRTSGRVPASRPGSGRGPLAAGLPVAGWAAGAGLVTLALPVLLVWASDSRSGAGALSAVRAVGQLWLLAHTAALEVPGGRLGLAPLGLLLLPLALLVRAGAAAARTHDVPSLREGAVLTAAVAGPYALMAAVVAGLSRDGGVRPAPVDALVCASVVALLGAGTGVLRESALLPGLRDRLPPLLLRLLRPAGAAVLVLLAGGAVLVGARLALDAGRAADLARASAPGAVGGVALLLLGVLLVPNAVVWGASWLAGPGFAVGAGTAVSPFAHALGPVPALPLLAALPAGALPVWLGALGLFVPLAGGVVAGVLRARTSQPGAVQDAALCGPAAGVVVLVLAWLSGGPVGGARLSEVGPSPWRVALAVAAEVAVGAAAAAWLWGRRSR